MTEQEAIRILSKDTSMEAVNELIHAGFNREIVIEHIQEAMTMGAKALEKQLGIERATERLEEEGKLADEDKGRCARENPLQFDRALGYSNGIFNAIEIIKEEMGIDDQKET